MSKSTPHKDVEYLSFLGTVVHMTPLAFQIYAMEFCDAGSELPKTDGGFPRPVFFLFCRSIELSLKSFLNASGLSVTELSTSPYAHRLSALLSKAETLKLFETVPITEVDRDIIIEAEPYYAEKLFEYPSIPEAGRAFKGAPDLRQLESTARVLAEGLKNFAMEATNNV